MQLELEIAVPELAGDLAELTAKLTFGIEREIKLGIRRGNASASGRTYKRSPIKRGRGEKRRIVGYNFHRASAPGQTPAFDTGHLLNSIRADVDGTQGAIAISAEYAGLLEYGSDGGQLAPRPFVQPAIDVALERVLPTL